MYCRLDGRLGAARDDRRDLDCDAREVFEYVDMRLFAKEGGRGPVVRRVGVGFVIRGGRDARPEFEGEEVDDGEELSGGEVILLAMIKRLWRLCRLFSLVSLQVYFLHSIASITNAWEEFARSKVKNFVLIRGLKSFVFK